MRTEIMGRHNVLKFPLESPRAGIQEAISPRNQNRSNIMAINLIKKISVNKIIGGKPKISDIVAFFAANPAAATMPVCKMYGEASGIKTGTSDFGDWTALTGQFRGMNIKTGEVFDSGVCFMPDVAQDLILGALDGADDIKKTVEFVFDIGVKLDESSATGYVYTATPIMQEAENPISRIEAKLLAMIPAHVPDLEAETTGKKTRK